MLIIALVGNHYLNGVSRAQAIPTTKRAEKMLTYNVLVVDDDTGIRDLLEGLLEEEG